MHNDLLDWTVALGERCDLDTLARMQKIRQAAWFNQTKMRDTGF